MKLLWLSYLVYSFGNCTMKLCIETPKALLGASQFIFMQYLSP